MMTTEKAEEMRSFMTKLTIWKNKQPVALRDRINDLTMTRIQAKITHDQFKEELRKIVADADKVFLLGRPLPRVETPKASLPPSRLRSSSASKKRSRPGAASQTREKKRSATQQPVAADHYQEFNKSVRATVHLTFSSNFIARIETLERRVEFLLAESVTAKK